FSRLLRGHSPTREQCIALYGLRPLVYVVTRSEAMRTVTNIFTCSLALSDLPIAFFCMPVTMLQDVFNNWLGGESAPFPSPLTPSLPGDPLPNTHPTLLTFFHFSLYQMNP
ncbi:hypothetical protein E2I00_018526, partial [Balaenoptera physalus]